VDVFFSADVETDGAIPGPFSMLSFALVYAGTYDGNTFCRPQKYDRTFYRELKPISEKFDPEALAINGLDRAKLKFEGAMPTQAMDEACDWIQQFSGAGKPVLVAYPLSFDWTWLYWYFIQYSKRGSPFGHSRCFDLKTAVAVKTGRTISSSSRAKLPVQFTSARPHTHHAVDDAIEQAEIFANIFEGKAE
jgi:DNA polymerase III epsilon subunit-like protein